MFRDLAPDLYGATDRTTGIAGGMEGDRRNAGTLADSGTADSTVGRQSPTRT